MINKIEKMIENILNKKFSKSISVGYDPMEVDLFLDDVIKFLNHLLSEAESLNSSYKLEENKLREANEKLKNITNRYKYIKEEYKSLLSDGYGSNRIMRDISELNEKIEKITKNEKKI